MKSCRGCRHYIARFGVCSAVDHELITHETSPHDGVTRTRCQPRPTIDAMRAPGAPCGPDAVLYRPTWYRAVWDRLVNRA
jgi:hypothetical protein